MTRVDAELRVERRVELTNAIPLVWVDVDQQE